MRLQIQVRLWRGAIAESLHRVELAVCDAEGREHAVTAEPRRITTLRSAAKPFQLTPLVERGHADRWGFSDLELAVMASSHTGSPRHVQLVRGILERIGLAEGDLACGIDPPLDGESLDALRRGEQQASPVFHNCSGKHAGMLALCRAEGWPVEQYRGEDHPVQRLMHHTVAGICGLTVEEVPSAVDGCSVRVFAMPLAAMARGYARIATASPDGDDRERALARIRDAMRAHPWAVGGAERFSTALMSAAPNLVAKGGAEGLECIGWPERGLGIALKCEDGAGRAVAPAAIAVLAHLGALDDEARRGLLPWAEPVTRNAAGLKVGMLRAELHAPAMAGR